MTPPDMMVIGSERRLGALLYLCGLCVLLWLFTVSTAGLLVDRLSTSVLVLRDTF